MVSDRCQAAGAHRQRDQELLELHHQEAAQGELGGFVSGDHYGMRIAARAEARRRLPRPRQPRGRRPPRNDQEHVADDGLVLLDVFFLLHADPAVVSDGGGIQELQRRAPPPAPRPSLRRWRDAGAAIILP